MHLSRFPVRTSNVLLLNRMQVYAEHCWEDIYTYTHVDIYIYTSTHTHIHIYIYIGTCKYICIIGIEGMVALVGGNGPRAPPPHPHQITYVVKKLVFLSSANQPASLPSQSTQPA